LRKKRSSTFANVSAAQFAANNFLICFSLGGELQQQRLELFSVRLA